MYILTKPNDSFHFDEFALTGYIFFFHFPNMLVSITAPIDASALGIFFVFCFARGSSVSTLNSSIPCKLNPSKIHWQFWDGLNQLFAFSSKIGFCNKLSVRLLQEAINSGHTLRASSQCCMTIPYSLKHACLNLLLLF